MIIVTLKNNILFFLCLQVDTNEVDIFNKNEFIGKLIILLSTE